MQSEFSGIIGRISKGIGANIVTQILNMLSKLAIVPLFIYSWGTQLYGEWLLVSSFVSYLALTDMGATNYVINKLTQKYAEGDLKEYNHVAQTGIRIFLLLPIIILMLALIMVLVIPFENIFNMQLISGLQLDVILLLFGFQVAVSLFSGYIIGIYRTIGLYSRGIMLSNLSLLTQFVLTVTILVLKGNIFAIISCQIIPIIIIMFFAIYDLKDRIQLDLLLISKKSFLFNKNDISFMASFFYPSLNFLFIQISQIVMLQAPVLIVGALFGPAQVVVFSTLRTIVNIVRQVLGIMINSAKPEITRLDILNKDNELSLLVVNIMKFSIKIGALFGIIFHLFGFYIYRLWINEATYDPEVMDLFMVNTLILIYWFSFADILMAINKHKKLSFILLISSMVSLIFCYGGSYFIGSLEGAVLGLIIADLILPLWLVPKLVLNYKPLLNVKDVFINFALILAYIIVISLNNDIFGYLMLFILLVHLYLETRKLIVSKNFSRENSFKL
ncbi:hypothetical protein TCA2_3602 [Paenibacillus sp. TCA20]|uniref:lipopolysaccharide biosynthesis protein n=1 Tax=Paenibacillus sp. TCA20 TaxID=1499968 RepID=UPI0004D367D0|nr:hypothetical protein [Paenibacillus sp. TCA20]GAK41111.1 hypothetical protein TCA2_3602 [Paenibacillus sp. TCA20]